MNKNTILNPENKIENHIDSIIQIHIAEYNALTTRSTYFINIQNILLTALIAWIIFVASIWKSNCENTLIWILLLGSQLIAIINANFSYEHYTIIKYIEKELKPKISDLINQNWFWNYEIFLKEARSTNMRHYGVILLEFLAVVLLGILLIAIIVYLFRKWTNLDSLGLLLNLILFAFIFIQTYKCTKLRLRNWK